MANFHQTIIAGHLGRDVELRYMPNGDAVCNFSVAVTESWTSNGEKKEQTTWYRVAAFKKLAEICSQYLKKGSSVMIVGKMNVREWEKDGVKRESWELRADSMQMLGGKHDGQQSGSSAQTSRPAPASKPAASSGGSFNDFEDDIPFLQIGRGASAYVI